MSTKIKNVAPHDPLWPRRVAALRLGVIGALRAIDAGEITDEQLQNLRGFAMNALKMMERGGPGAWQEAKALALADYEALAASEAAAPGQREQGRASALLEASRAVSRMRNEYRADNGEQRAEHWRADTDEAEAFDDGVGRALDILKGIKA